MIKAVFSQNPVTGKEYFHGFLQIDDECAQWIADVYHCSDSWGQTMTDEAMRILLIETAQEKFPEDYSPDPSLYRECAAYWNELCEAHPN